jgi:uncharacterized DUF497 family protein
MELTFEWDENKAHNNLRKHGVSLNEAATIFLDPFSITIGNPDRSISEDRFVDIGASSNGRILVVVYTERGQNIRLISGRKATSSEIKRYEQEYL